LWLFHVITILQNRLFMSPPFEDLIDIYPSVWPERQLKVLPGDLRHFAPMGIGDIRFHIEEPSEERPYSLTAHPVDPFLAAPVTEPCGGTVYFGGDPNAADLAALLRLLRVRSSATDYAAFVGRSDNPEEHRHLTQLRLVRRSALVGLYGALSIDEMAHFPEQRLNVGDAVQKFVESEQTFWGMGMTQRLRGRFGGDGARTQESLAFGFMVENSYYGVYRIWSRAWLVAA